MGLALVGKVIEHVLPILTGTGRNGKGTFVRTVTAALGSYAIEAKPDLFVARERAHPPGQLDLRGVRLATCQETDDGRRLNVAAVKRLTGGDTIRARKMRQDFIEFAPSHLPFLITNHLPKVPADDPALWARLLVLPFDQSFLGREDRDLEDRLRDELPTVLAWAVAGWDDYQQRGRLDPPAAVCEATSTYRVSNDSIAAFIDDRCLLNSGTCTSSRPTCGTRGKPGATRTPNAQAPTGHSRQPSSREGSPTPDPTGGHASRASA